MAHKDQEQSKNTSTKKKVNESSKSAAKEASHAAAADKDAKQNEKLEAREQSELKRKPVALRVGDHYHYTLSSYDPVAVTVHVPSVGDVDVEFMMENMAHANHTTLAKIDDAWVEKNLEGLKTVEDFKKAMRAQAEHLNAHYTEDQKTGAVLEALARRLEQEVPLDEIARYRDQLYQAMKFDAEKQGTTLEHMLSHMGVGEAGLDAMLDERAAQTAGQDAALAAYAEHKKLKVPTEEIPAILHLPPQQGEEVIEQAQKAGQMAQLERTCRNAKAAQLVVGEADVTYSHDTPEQTKAREEHMRGLLQQIRAMDQASVVEGNKEKKDQGNKKDGKKDEGNGKGDGTKPSGFKVV